MTAPVTRRRIQERYAAQATFQLRHVEKVHAACCVTNIDDVRQRLRDF